MLIEKVVELTNAEREKAGLQPLKINNQLANAAQDHSNDMAQDDFFSHTGADGSSVSDRVEDSGYQYSTTGENIAAGQTSAEEVVEGWMNSPGHRANILNPDYTEIGVGYKQLQNDPGSVNYDSYWTQVFGNSSENNSNNTKSSDSDSVDPIEDSANFTDAPKKDSINSMDSLSNNKFEIGDNSLDQNLFMDNDTKPSDSDSVDPMKDSASFFGTPNEDSMVSTDSSSDRSFSTSSDTKFEDLNLVDLIPDSASFLDTPNEDSMVSTDSSSDRSFSTSSDTKFEDLVDLMNSEIENSPNFASDTFSENFCQMYI